ncbi:MAG: hypothetical protein ACJ75J_03145 [Cytophagaceae bacterium]
MRKLSALLLVAGVFAFASCQKKADETTKVDSTSTTVVDSIPVVTPAAPDSTSMKADSSSMKKDEMKKEEVKK